MFAVAAVVVAAVGGWPCRAERTRRRVARREGGSGERRLRQDCLCDVAVADDVEADYDAGVGAVLAMGYACNYG